MVIVQQLVRTLPERYVAEPRAHLGAEIEVDIGAYEEVGADRRRAEETGTATACSASRPTLMLETGLADTDEYEVRIYDTRRRRRLVAAVELISPSNKDPAESRAQFVSKSAAMLRRGVCLVLVDLVTIKQFNLYAELLRLVDGSDPSLGTPPPATYAAACRWRPIGVKMTLEAWSQPLVVGDPLPVLPLF